MWVLIGYSYYGGDIMKYKNKIVLIVVFISIISSLLVGIFLIIKTRAIVYDESVEKMDYVVFKYTLDINSEIKLVEKSVNELNEIILKNLDSSRLYSDKEYLNEFVDFLIPSVRVLAQNLTISKSTYVFFDPNISGIHDIWYADLNNDGNVERQDELSLEYYDGDTVKKAWFYVPYNTRRAVWTKPYYGALDISKNIVYISYTSPVIVDDKVIAVTGSDYYYKLLKEKINKMEIYPNACVFLLDIDNEVIIKSGAEMPNMYDVEFSKKLLGMIKHETSGVLEIDNDLYAYSSLINGWKLILKVPKKVVFSEVNRLTKLATIIVITLSILFGLIGYYVSKKIFEPIEKLSLKVKEIEEGNYSDPIEIKYLHMKDEIGSLAKSIEKMRIRQKISFEKIKSHNLELEKKVLDRTKELLKTNEYLEVSLSQLEEQQAELIISNDKLEAALEAEKNVKKELIESEKIASLGYLVSGVAHEINTPVGNCITMSTFMEREVGELKKNLENNTLKKKYIVEYIENMIESTNLLSRNLRILKNLMDKFKELAVEKTVNDKVDFNVYEYVSSIVGTFRREQEIAKIRFHIICDRDLVIKSDPLKFSQIIKNLISNSIYHAFPEKEGIITIDIEKKYDSLFIEFTDDGIGIGEEELKNIFTPFYSKNLKFKSSGLGLNVVHNIVSNIFRGEIKVESKENVGTTFKIVLKL